METNPASSIISALGVGSGVDMLTLANDLAVARFQAQIGQLESRNQTLETKISAASTLRGQLNQLASALGERIRTGDLSAVPSIANTAVATVRGTPGAPASGNYSLEVTRLASAQVLAGKVYSSGQDLVGEGTLTIRFGSISGTAFTEDTARTPLSIDVTAQDTLESLAAKISGSGEGLTAYVATNSSGSRLVIKGGEGDQQGFVLEAASTAASPASVPGDLTYLGWNPASDAGELRQSAQSATFLMDGVEMESQTNQVRGLPAGLSLDLVSTNIGNPTTIGFSEPVNAISSVMADFVAALNDITAQLSESAAPLGGELGNDSGARRLKRELAGLSTKIVMPNAASDAPKTLGDLGLKVTRQGTFELDNDRLTQTLEQSPEGASAMFTNGVFGIFATMDDLARSMSSRTDPGSLAGSVARYTSQMERIDDKLADIAEQQESLRQRLTSTFGAADRNVSSSQSTLSFIQSQIAIWNRDN